MDMIDRENARIRREKAEEERKVKARKAFFAASREKLKGNFGTMANGARVEILSDPHFDRDWQQKVVRIDWYERGNPAVKGRKPNGDRAQGKPHAISIPMSELKDISPNR